MVDIETNPLYYASAGGILLALSTSLHYILKGNVTGMSGIIYDVAFLNLSQFPNKMIIVGGIVMAAGIFFDIFGYGTYGGFTPFGPKEQISEYTSFLGFALAGLLTGFGTKLGNGCTSGHGLCGLARLSIRSFVAVGMFLASAIGIATLRYYVTLGPFSQKLSPSIDYAHPISANLCIAFGVLFVPVGFLIQKLYNRKQQQWQTILRDNLISLAVGLLFGAGLVLAGMARRRNIIMFLSMGVDWNPSLLFVLGCGVIINLVTFNYMIRVKKTPVYGEKLFNPDNSVIDWKLVLGAFTFGLGWGIGGICPGPALALLPVFQVQIHVIWLGCLIFGMYLAAKLVEYTQKKKIQNTETNNNSKQAQKNEKAQQPGHNKAHNRFHVHLDPIQHSQNIHFGQPNPNDLQTPEESSHTNLQGQAYNLDLIKPEHDDSKNGVIMNVHANVNVKKENKILEDCQIIEIDQQQRVGNTQ